MTEDFQDEDCRNVEGTTSVLRYFEIERLSREKECKVTNLVAEAVYEVEVGEGDGWVKKATIRNIGEHWICFILNEYPGTWWERIHCVGDVKCTPIKKCGGIVFPFFECKDIIFVGMDGYEIFKKISLFSDGIFSKRNKISER